MNATDDCAQIVELVELNIPMPLDDAEDNTLPTVPTRFQAVLRGNVLHVAATTNIAAQLQVENNSTGEVVVNKSFTTSTSASIPTAGSYTLYIISSNTAVAGQFEI